VVKREGNKNYISERGVSLIMAKQRKRVAAFLLALAVVITSLTPTGTFAATKKTTYVTRAYVLQQVEKLIGATKTSKDIKNVKDVKKSDSCYKTMSVALQAGLVKADSKSKLYPTKKATNKYVAGVLAKLSETTTAKVLGSKKASAKVTKTALKNWLGKKYPTVITESTSKVKKGNVVIKKPATLKNATVTGDLIVGDGVADKEVTLNNVTVKGKLIVRGGGTNSIIIKGSSSISNVIIRQLNYDVNLKIHGGATVSAVHVKPNSKNVTITGDVGTVDIEGADLNVNIAAGTVDELVVEESATGVTVTADKDSTVKNTTVDAEETTVAGDGTFSTVNVNANNTTITANVEILNKLEDIDVNTVNSGLPEDDDNSTSGDDTSNGGGSSSSGGSTSGGGGNTTSGDNNTSGGSTSNGDTNASGGNTSGGDNSGNTGDNSGNTGDNSGNTGDNSGNTGDNNGNNEENGSTDTGDNSGNTEENGGTDTGDNSGNTEENSGTDTGDNSGNTEENGSTDTGDNSGSNETVSVNYNTDTRFAEGYPKIEFGELVNSYQREVKVTYKLNEGEASTEKPAKIYGVIIDYDSDYVKATTESVKHGHLMSEYEGISNVYDCGYVSITDDGEYVVTYTLDPDSTLAIVYSIIDCNGTVSKTPTKTTGTATDTDTDAYSVVSNNTGTAYTKAGSNVICLYYYVQLDTTSVPDASDYTVEYSYPSTNENGYTYYIYENIGVNSVEIIDKYNTVSMSCVKLTLENNLPETTKYAHVTYTGKNLKKTDGEVISQYENKYVITDKGDDMAAYVSADGKTLGVYVPVSSMGTRLFGGYYIMDEGESVLKIDGQTVDASKIIVQSSSATVSLTVKLGNDDDAISSESHTITVEPKSGNKFYDAVGGEIDTLQVTEVSVDEQLVFGTATFEIYSGGSDFKIPIESGSIDTSSGYIEACIFILEIDGKEYRLRGNGSIDTHTGEPYIYLGDVLSGVDLPDSLDGVSMRIKVGIDSTDTETAYTYGLLTYASGAIITSTDYVDVKVTDDRTLDTGNTDNNGSESGGDIDDGDDVDDGDDSDDYDDDDDDGYYYGEEISVTGDGVVDYTTVVTYSDDEDDVGSVDPLYTVLYVYGENDGIPEDLTVETAECEDGVTVKQSDKTDYDGMFTESDTTYYIKYVTLGPQLTAVSDTDNTISQCYSVFESNNKDASHRIYVVAGSAETLSESAEFTFDGVATDSVKIKAVDNEWSYNYILKVTYGDTVKSVYVRYTGAFKGPDYFCYSNEEWINKWTDNIYCTYNEDGTVDLNIFADGDDTFLTPLDEIVGDNSYYVSSCFPSPSDDGHCIVPTFKYVDGELYLVVRYMYDINENQSTLVEKTRYKVGEINYSKTTDDETD
jgi:hypothetical protein